MPSISTMIELIAKLDSPAVTVHQERCVLVRNRNADCLRCAEACTSGCIHYDGNKLLISPERCIGCGTCATACPTCALEACHPNDAYLLNQCRTAVTTTDAGDSVCLACGSLLNQAAGTYDTEKVVRVECLGRVEESLLTTLIADGVTNLVLVHGDCENCEHTTGRAMVQRVYDTEQLLLDVWDSPARVRITRKLPARTKAPEADYNKQKRGAFKLGGREALHAGTTAVNLLGGEAVKQALTTPSTKPSLKVMDDGTLPHFLPDRRERLLDALARLGQPHTALLNTRLWGHVIIDTTACTSCQMCATFCPTGAISKFEDENGTFGVEHYPGDCVKCRCCTTICPAGALELSEEVFALDMLAGMTDRYEMQPRAVERGKSHTIWNLMKTMTSTDQIYER